MGKCPYCSNELHLGDFFDHITKVTKSGAIRVKGSTFKGEQTASSPYIKMWVCPMCDTILGFSEWYAIR